MAAPVADALVAHILAASTYPTQIVEVTRFLKQNSNLTGDALVNAVSQQSWDPSVMALTQIPLGAAEHEHNLSWTSTLGDAYYATGLTEKRWRLTTPSSRSS